MRARPPTGAARAFPRASGRGRAWRVNTLVPVAGA
jgi:hypothetical protein